MTTATLTARPGSAVAAILARAFDEIQAFFQASSVAIARAERDQPFGG